MPLFEVIEPMEERISQVKIWANVLSTPGSNQENEANEAIEQWQSQDGSFLDSVFLLKTEKDELLHFIALNTMKRALLYSGSPINDNMIIEAFNVLIDLIESDQKFENRLVAFYRKTFSVVVAALWPEAIPSFFHDSLSRQNLSIFYSAIEDIFAENLLTTAKKTMLFDVIHKEFPAIINAVFRKPLDDCYALKLLEILSTVVAPKIIFDKQVILPLIDLLAEAKDEIGSVLSCLKAISLKRIDFELVFERFGLPILQALLSISETSNESRNMIAHLLAKYHKYVEPSDFLNELLNAVIQPEWVVDNDEYWSTWDILLDFYAIKHKIITTAQAMDLFACFCERIITGINEEDCISIATKACMTMIGHLFPDLVIKHLTQMASEGVSPELLYSLAACYPGFNEEWGIGFLFDLFMQVKDTLNEGLICPTAIAMSRFLFYMPENEGLWDSFCELMIFVFQSNSSPCISASISALNYLALRRPRLFTVAGMRLLGIAIDYLVEISPTMYGNQSIKLLVKVIGMATRYSKNPALKTQMITKFTPKVMQYLSQKTYSFLIKQPTTVNEEEEENDMPCIDETSFFFEEMPPIDEGQPNEQYNQSFEQYEIPPFLNENAVDIGRAKDLLHVEEFEEKEDNLVQNIINTLQLLQTLAQNSTGMQIFFLFHVGTFCANFVSEVNENAEGGYQITKEVYSLLEAIFLNCSCSFEEIKMVFQQFIEAAVRKPRLAKSCLHLLLKLLPKYPDIQFYLMCCYDSLIYPSLICVSESSATPEALQFLIACQFWNFSLEVPLPTLLSYRDFAIHEADSVLLFIDRILSVPLPQYIDGVLQLIGDHLITIVIEMLTDSTYHRFFNTAINTLKSVLTALLNCDYPATMVFDIFSQQMNEIAPAAVRKVPAFVQNLLENVENEIALYQIVRDFLINQHCCVTSDAGLFQLEHDSEDNPNYQFAELPDNDEDEDLWDDTDDDYDPEDLKREEEELQYAREKEERKRIKEEMLRHRKEEEEANEVYYFLGGFQVPKMEPFVEEAEQEEILQQQDVW